MKINFDGAVFHSIKSVGIGVVARDWRGNFKGGLCKLVKSPLDAACVEALAAYYAAELGMEMGLTSVILEGDSKSVVEDIRREEPNFSSEGVFIEQIKKIAIQFQEFSISWVRRSANVVADKISHYAFHCNNTVSWREVHPEFLDPFLQNDGYI